MESGQPALLYPPFFRIYPLSVFCITLAVILRIPSSTSENADIITSRVIVANFFLVQNLITKISVLGRLCTSSASTA
jgi:peptidoglycan/LPS O-acetylase OafA/YrhL